MYNILRGATIKCKTGGKLYAMDRGTFSNIVEV
jgi:hypothetical protein